MTIDAARSLLLAAARTYVDDENKHTELELCRAAAEYATARLALASGANVKPRPTYDAAPSDAPPSDGEVLLPFGMAKGQAISTAPLKDLRWVHGALLRSINDPAKTQWVESNEQLAGAIAAEIDRRGVV